MEVSEGFLKTEARVPTRAMAELWALVASVELPLHALPDSMGLGSAHELTIGRPLSGSTFRWVIAPPVKWQILDTIVATLMYLAYQHTGLLKPKGPVTREIFVGDAIMPQELARLLGVSQAVIVQMALSQLGRLFTNQESLSFEEAAEIAKRMEVTVRRKD